MKKTIVHYDGQLLKMDVRSLEKFLPGILKARGVFETILIKNGRTLFLKEHWLRFSKGIKYFKFKKYYSHNIFQQCIDEALRSNKLKNARVRVSAWRDGREEKLLVVCRWYRASSAKKGFKGIFFAHPMPAVKNPRIKSLEYQFFRKAFLFAQKNDCDEAIILNPRGQVVEGSRTNIFAVKDGKIYTPPVSLGCLQGIARGIVIRLAKKIGSPVREKRFDTGFLMQADEIFLTNSLIGVVPLFVIERTGISLGDNPVTCKLRNSYRLLTR